jgi:hypothetical protein
LRAFWTRSPAIPALGRMDLLGRLPPGSGRQARS